MGLLGRIVKGGINVLTAPLRLAAAPFSFIGKMLGTGLKTLKQLASFNITGALKTLVGGTVKNAFDFGVTLASKGNPLLAFVDGFARNSVRFS